MKVFTLAVLRKRGKDTRILASEYDVSSFGFFQRSSVREFIQFFMKTVTARAQPGTRSTVTEQEYACHCFFSNEGVAACVVTDGEYPARVALALANQMTEEFLAKYNRMMWDVDQPAEMPLSTLAESLVKYQNPAEADKLMKIQKDLDETKIILHKTIESVLERGEKLDVLVEKSEDLSRQSKTFYKTAKQTNSCCTFM